MVLTTVLPPGSILTSSSPPNANKPSASVPPFSSPETKKAEKEKAEKEKAAKEEEEDLQEEKQRERAKQRANAAGDAEREKLALSSKEKTFDVASKNKNNDDDDDEKRKPDSKEERSVAGAMPINPLHAVIEARLREASKAGSFSFTGAPSSSASSSASSVSSSFSSPSSSFTALRARQLDHHLAAAAAATAPLTSHPPAMMPYKKRPREAFHSPTQQQQQQRRQEEEEEEERLGYGPSPVEEPRHKRARITGARFHADAGSDRGVARINADPNDAEMPGTETPRGVARRRAAAGNDDDNDDDDEFQEEEDLEVVKLERSLEPRRSLEGAEAQNNRADMLSPLWRPF